MFGLRALITHSGSTSVTGDHSWHKKKPKKKNQKATPNPLVPTDYRQQHVVQEQGDEHDEQDESPGLPALPQPPEEAELVPSHRPRPLAAGSACRHTTAP